MGIGRGRGENTERSIKVKGSLIKRERGKGEHTFFCLFTWKVGRGGFLKRSTISF
jgi:hypothetical protein